MQSPKVRTVSQPSPTVMGTIALKKRQNTTGGLPTHSMAYTPTQGSACGATHSRTRGVLTSYIRPQSNRHVFARTGLLGTLHHKVLNGAVPTPQETFTAQLKTWFGSEMAIIQRGQFDPFESVLASEFKLAHGYETGAPPRFEKGADRVFQFEGEYSLFGSLMQRLKSFAPESMASWLQYPGLNIRTQWILEGNKKLLQIYHKGRFLEYSFLIEPIRIEYTDKPWEGKGTVRLILHYHRPKGPIIGATENKLSFQPNLFGAVIYEFSPDEDLKNPLAKTPAKLALNLFLSGSGTRIDIAKHFASKAQIQKSIKNTYALLVAVANYAHLTS